MTNKSINIATLLSSDKRPSGIQKVDRDGNFQFFEGLTIVMPLQTNVNTMFNELKQAIPQNTRAILPKESYHITLISVACRSRFKSCEEYNRYIRNNMDRFNNVKKLLNESSTSLKFKMREPNVSNNSHFAVLMEPADDQTRETLNSLRLQCFEALGVKPYKNEWHMSLCYKYRGCNYLQQPELTNIRNVLTKHLDGVNLTLGPPKLCSFKDMCKFTPVKNIAVN